ncbi:MAG: diguanylate cyclase [Lachnospiraceae bacterium]|nr:diguanylate cyclase [Lachnospiraceae bacterium]
MKKILIVDDEEIFLKITRNFLSNDYEVVTALSGEKAIEIFKETKPDLVLSDLMMPGMSGYELLSRINESEGNTIPFIFMTADDREESEAKGFDTGALDYIKKPFKKDILLRRVANIINQQSQMQVLKKEAQTDLLTGLLNKASSEYQITDLCKKETGMLMIIDLDSFKLVNDLYGHDMGDKLLVSFSNILQTQVRTGDIVGRIGGDEFIAFCHHIQSEDVISAKATDINTALLSSARELMGENMSIPLGASLGVVRVPSDGCIFSELFKKADTALYEVKQNGKHGYRFFSEMNASIASSAPDNEQLSDLRRILGERDPFRGAMTVDFETFQSIYRFLVRSTENYHKSVAFMKVTLTGEDVSETVRNNFFEILTKVLRKSDVITKNGITSILALLPETDDKYGQVAVERAMDYWQNTDPETYSKYNIETILENLT